MNTPDDRKKHHIITKETILCTTFLVGLGIGRASFSVLSGHFFQHKVFDSTIRYDFLLLLAMIPLAYYILTGKQAIAQMVLFIGCGLDMLGRAVKLYPTMVLMKEFGIGPNDIRSVQSWVLLEILPSVLMLLTGLVVLSLYSEPSDTKGARDAHDR